MDENFRHLSSYILVKTDDVIKANSIVPTYVKFKGSYYYAINCIIYPFQNDIIVVAPIHCLQSQLAQHSIDSLKQSYCTKYNENNTFTSKLEFYLSLSSNIENIQEEFFVKICVKKLLQIEEVSNLIQLFLKSGNVSVGGKNESVDNPYSNNSSEIQNWTIDLFILAKINRSELEFNKLPIVEKLLKTKFNVCNGDIKLGDSCKIITNSLILNSYNQFKSRIHNAYISLIKEYKSIKIMWLGLNGLKGQEGSLVCNKNITGIIGIVLPAIYHEGIDREAINQCIPFEIFLKYIESNLNGNILTSSINSHSNQIKFNRINTINSHLNPNKVNQNHSNLANFDFKKNFHLENINTLTKNEVVNKWIQRVGFLETYGYDGFVFTGSCLYLKNGYILTNAHLFSKKSKSIAFMTINHKRYKILYTKISTGSFDLALCYTDEKLEELDREYNNLINYDEIEKGIPENSNVYIIGYPIFDQKLYNNCIYCSKGVLSKKVKGSNETSLLQSTGLIYSGNSGGIQQNSKGKFGGIIISCAKEDEGPINNINLSISAKNFIDILKYVDNQNSANSTWDETYINNNIKSLSYKDQEMDEQCSYVSSINQPKE